jgi:hypothetical protein
VANDEQALNWSRLFFGYAYSVQSLPNYAIDLHCNIENKSCKTSFNFTVINCVALSLVLHTLMQDNCLYVRETIIIFSNFKF